MMVFYPMPMAISYHHSLYCQAVRVVLCTGNWPPLQAGAECGLGQINSSSVKTGELGVTSYRGQRGAVHPLAHPCLGSGDHPRDRSCEGCWSRDTPTAAIFIFDSSSQSCGRRSSGNTSPGSAACTVPTPWVLSGGCADRERSVRGWGAVMSA